MIYCRICQFASLQQTTTIVCGWFKPQSWSWSLLSYLSGDNYRTVYIVEVVVSVTSLMPWRCLLSSFSPPNVFHDSTIKLRMMDFCMFDKSEREEIRIGYRSNTGQTLTTTQPYPSCTNLASLGSFYAFSERHVSFFQHGIVSPYESMPSTE